jgi:hypothetical protein
MSPDSRAKFGKHKGKTAAWIMKNDWRYMDWAKLNVPNLFEDSTYRGSTESDRSWGKPIGIPNTVPKFQGEREVPPERDDNDPNSSSFLYNIAKRLMDNGEL